MGEAAGVRNLRPLAQAYVNTHCKIVLHFFSFYSINYYMYVHVHIVVPLPKSPYFQSYTELLYLF